MQMQINSNDIPRKGDESSVIGRLIEYIDYYNDKWKYQIEGASEEQIQQLRDKVNIKQWADDFPKSYLCYLRAMGNNDGGLCNGFLEGKGCISEIIDLYTEYEEYEPDTIKYPFFSFYNATFRDDLFFSLLPNEKRAVVNVWEGRIEKIFCESFEKFLFQAAYYTFEKYKNKRRFSVAPAKMKIHSQFVETILKKICIEFGLKRSWISDDLRYIARGNKISFVISTEHGVWGTITGDDEYLVQQIIDCFIGYFGVDEG